MLEKYSRLIGKSNRGFTLVELMIVVIIIGVLVMIVIPVYNHSTKQASPLTLLMVPPNGHGTAILPAQMGHQPVLAATTKVNTSRILSKQSILKTKMNPIKTINPINPNQPHQNYQSYKPNESHQNYQSII